MVVSGVLAAHTSSRFEPAAPRSAASAEFLPLPGCLPAFACGPAGQIDLASLRKRFLGTPSQQGLQALGNADKFLAADGELDFLLYNYLFMSSINKELAVQGLQQRMQEIACPHRGPAAPGPGPALAPVGL